MDTAGIRETKDLVEKIGVEKSRELAQDADLILFLLDSSHPLEKQDMEILKLLEDKKVLILLNKSDQPAAIDQEELECLTGSTIIKTSMVDGTGLEQVEEFIYNMVYSGGFEPRSHVMITNNRHKEALIRLTDFGGCLDALDASMPLIWFL